MIFSLHLQLSLNATQMAASLAPLGTTRASQPAIPIPTWPPRISCHVLATVETDSVARHASTTRRGSMHCKCWLWRICMPNREHLLRTKPMLRGRRILLLFEPGQCNNYTDQRVVCCADGV